MSKPAAKRSPARAGPRRPARIVSPKARRSAGVGAQLGRAVKAIPVPAAMLRRLRNWTLGLLIAAALVAGVVAMGLPQAVGLGAAHLAGALGFQVRTIELVGRGHVDADAVYRVAADARGQDMPLVDLQAVRRGLLGLGWVKDARVSRRLPDTLVIDLVERKPAAVWQYRQRLALIDADGTVIAPVDRTSALDALPLVIGPEANTHAAALASLIASQPSLRPLVEGANWIGGRRWDIRFNTGEVLALPEGEEPARAAFAEFARRDSQTRLLGQGYVRFDLRDPQRFVVRTSREPGLRLDKPAPAAPAAPAGEAANAPAGTPARADEKTA